MVDVPYLYYICAHYLKLLFRRLLLPLTFQPDFQPQWHVISWILRVIFSSFWVNYYYYSVLKYNNTHPTSSKIKHQFIWRAMDHKIIVDDAPSHRKLSDSCSSGFPYKKFWFDVGYEFIMGKGLFMVVYFWIRETYFASCKHHAWSGEIKSRPAMVYTERSVDIAEFEMRGLKIVCVYEFSFPARRRRRKSRARVLSSAATPVVYSDTTQFIVCWYVWL